jgi:hypothetical protein
MGHEACPRCYGPLEVRDTTPCMLCGGAPEELLHYRDHTYHEVEVYPGLRLVLCNFCQVDLGSYDPGGFDRPSGARIGLEWSRLVRSVDKIVIAKDKYCPTCKARLALLRAMAERQESDET